ncbi:hypothetical protein [Streptomyces aureus]|uniref:hypothetical protein n=1 Tax=Streptomyces aureus TaxID=193461 RepID=UPI003464FB9C
MLHLMQPSEVALSGASLPGAIRLVRAANVAALDPEAVMFTAMLTGWEQQQRSRLLTKKTITDRLSLVRRFAEFTGTYPWDWTPRGRRGVLLRPALAWRAGVAHGSGAAGRLGDVLCVHHRRAVRLGCGLLGGVRPVPGSGVSRLEHRS